VLHLPGITYFIELQGLVLSFHRITLQQTAACLFTTVPKQNIQLHSGLSLLALNIKNFHEQKLTSFICNSPLQRRPS
jgi:hypothetical protein